jgi:hypothetical protein
MECVSLKAQDPIPHRESPGAFVRIPTPQRKTEQFFVAKTRVLCLILTLSPHSHFPLKQ